MNLGGGYETLDVDAQVHLVHQAWQQALPRLLIFDNCEDEALVQDWRPRSGGCRVLVTSRRARWSPVLNVQTLPLGVLARAESIALLRKHRPDLSEEDADAIAAELGDLPLALHLAGSFLHRYRDAITPAAYLRQLQRPDLLAHVSLQTGGPSPTAHEQHVARTFALSLERLDATDATDALALALLARAACFAPGEPIPRDLLLATLAPAPAEEDAAESAAEPLAQADALARLLALGLLEITSTTPIACTLHRLLAAFVQAGMEEEGAQAAVETTMLDRANTLNNAGYPAPLLALQTHLRHVTDTARTRRDEQAASLCNALGYHLQMIGDYRGAVAILLRRWPCRSGNVLARHPRTSLGAAPRHRPASTTWALCCKRMGDFAGARPYYERALAIRGSAGRRAPRHRPQPQQPGLSAASAGRLCRGAPVLRAGAGHLREVLGAEPPRHRQQPQQPGRSAASAGRPAGARPYYERALAIDGKCWAPSTPTPPAASTTWALC